MSSSEVSPDVHAGNPPSRNAPWWIKAFVAFHVVAITMYSVPLPPESLRTGKVQPFGSDWLLYLNWKYTRRSPIVQAYAFGSGFWQYWDMFAPDPVNTDQYGTAKIFYKDGKVLDYQYPRMYSLSIPQKFLQERYRKFYERAHDATVDTDEKKLYVEVRFAQRIALINFNDRANPPVEVKLFIHEWPVPPPGGSLVPKYSETQYFDYVVDQDLLFQDKGVAR